MKLNPIVSKQFKNVKEFTIKMKKGECHKSRLQVVNGFAQQIWVINQNKKNKSKKVDKYFNREDFCRENEDSNIIKEEPEEILIEDEAKLRVEDDKLI